MSYDIYLSLDIKRLLKKLEKKDRQHYLNVEKKIGQIIENPYHYKPLRGDLSGSRRAHIGSYVLIYEINESGHYILFLKYQHHDNVYLK
ncbi:type II toxin-antitoxin system RelE family toxin [Methanobacterium petrolearium]|uniref:type II toxin-antitoxin system RelE family toxin n=1 Tax=Methanobacterium petrolearium TaxID=710190 RepID=UPI001AE4C60F|nr:type II toxin-antitoxin system RelE/ParE family toxin [Methanobacterium petrolearium]MBP1946305.1 mRNA interferase RelE/StbE/toxin YoeB [Methanobacterium petrolearium]BDZ71403.1 YafQ family addiction module toxin [Methanobacterium petrolearium]